MGPGKGGGGEGGQKGKPREEMKIYIALGKSKERATVNERKEQRHNDTCGKNEFR
jgi:hypothetical protein